MKLQQEILLVSKFRFISKILLKIWVLSKKTVKRVTKTKISVNCLENVVLGWKKLQKNSFNFKSYLSPQYSKPLNASHCICFCLGILKQCISFSLPSQVLNRWIGLHKCHWSFSGEESKREFSSNNVRWLSFDVLFLTWPVDFYVELFFLPLCFWHLSSFILLQVYLQLE